MLTLRRHADWDGAMDEVWALYEASFPLHERRRREDQTQAMREPNFRCLSAWDGSVFAGLALCWAWPCGIYVEHLAVAPELRGRRYGARILAALKEEGRPLILEIDPPVDELSIRRKGFYQRAGFWENPFLHVHPPYRPQFKGHPLTVMTYPTPWDRGTYETFWVCLRDTVMADCKTDEQ